MRTLFTVGLVALLACAGCGKKNKDVAKVSKDKPTPTTVTVTTSPTTEKKKETPAGNEPTQPVNTEQPAPTPSTQPTPPKTGTNTNFVGGGGPAKNIRNAAKRTVGLNELKQLGLYITQHETELNKMPTKAEIMEIIKNDKLLTDLITEGSLILTETMQREGLWAYEYESDSKGGMVLVSGVAQRATAEEVRKHMGK